MNEIDRARVALDAAHRADPAGVSGELRYVDCVQSWIGRLVPQPSPALLLAARAQHLERWVIPRSDYPEGRGGYLRWRAAVHERQGQRTRRILVDAGCDGTLADRVAALVSKKAPRDDAEAQALEDAACLVFLETELADFAREHPREKVVEVLRKTWRKMGPAGREAALGLSLPEPLAEVVREAVG